MVMKLSITALTAVGLASASANTISVNSKRGRSLMKKARKLDGDGDFTWAADYSIQFQKCATSNDYYGNYFGGNGDNNNQNNENGYNGIYEQRLVHFKLCPSGTCSGNCAGGADYVVDMNEFVAAYIENKLETQEIACENAQANCENYCQNANDDEACQNQCLYNEGLDYCIENDNQNNQNGQEEFELEQAAECARLEVDEDAAQYYAYENGLSYYNQNDNGNGNNGDIEFFVGPYCSSNGKSINLGVFMDEMCSYDAPKGVYETFYYGNSLPYSSESLVTNECISCMAPKDEDQDQNGNNNNYYYNNGNNNNNNGNNNGNNNNNNNNNGDEEEDEVKEFCERLYEEAGKCETNLNVYGVYPNTMGCQFISSLGKTSVMSSIAETTKNHTAGVLASLFAVTTVVFAGVSYHFHKKTQRATIGLNSGGSMA